jgi:hypothetical protein
LELPEQLSTGDLSEPAIGLTPIPNLAESVGNMTAALLSLLGDQLPDHAQIFFSNGAAPNDQWILHGPVPYQGQNGDASPFFLFLQLFFLLTSAYPVNGYGFSFFKINSSQWGGHFSILYLSNPILFYATRGLSKRWKSDRTLTIEVVSWELPCLSGVT